MRISPHSTVPSLLAAMLFVLPPAKAEVLTLRSGKILEGRITSADAKRVILDKKTKVAVKDIFAVSFSTFTTYGKQPLAPAAAVQEKFPPAESAEYEITPQPSGDAIIKLKLAWDARHSAAAEKLLRQGGKPCEQDLYLHYSDIAVKTQSSRIDKSQFILETELEAKDYLLRTGDTAVAVLPRLEFAKFNAVAAPQAESSSPPPALAYNLKLPQGAAVLSLPESFHIKNQAGLLYFQCSQDGDAVNCQFKFERAAVKNPDSAKNKAINEALDTVSRQAVFLRFIE